MSLFQRYSAVAAAVLIFAGNAAAQRGGHGGHSGHVQHGGPRSFVGSRIGFGGLGFGYGYGLGGFGLGGGYGNYGVGGYGLGVPLGSWGSQPSFFPARPLVPSAAPLYLDRRPASMFAAPIATQENAGVPQVEPQDATPVTTIPSVPTTSQSALVKLQLPDPNAQVWFGTELMAGSGGERAFRSPELALGQTFVYTLKARWQADGKSVEVVKQATVRAGDSLTVSFVPAAPEPAAAPPAAPVAPALAPVQREADDALVVIPSR